MIHRTHPPVPVASDGVIRHIRLPAAERWRCCWHGRAGTVTARVELAGAAWGYDVRLDDGATRRALPCDLRRVPAVALVDP